MQDIRLAVGKGASLSKLMGIGGISVPDGYIITTEAYKAFVEPVVRPFMGKLRGEGDGPALAGDEIKGLIGGLRLPPDFEAQLKAVLDAAGPDALFAVRSSARRRICPTRLSPGSRIPF
jgi:pyruvate,water dikinase